MRSLDRVLGAHCLVTSLTARSAQALGASSSAPPRAGRQGWQSHVLGPRTRDVTPARITSVSGDVRAAGARVTRTRSDAVVGVHGGSLVVTVTPRHRQP